MTQTGNITVKGISADSATQVADKGLDTALCAYKTFAKDGFSLTTSNFTGIATDTLGRSDTNSVAVPPGVNQSFTYDQNGNLLSDGRRGFDYDDENQLIRITSTNAWKSEFVYDLSSIARSATEDGLQRRRMSREFTWTGSAWQTTNEVRYIYWARLVLQERHFDPRLSTLHPVRTVSYTRGLDLSGSIEGAGGIGGLLARSDHSPLTTSHSFYHHDAIGNVTALVNDAQAVVARYLYDPFGNLMTSSGPMADANLYRFSSKELHANSGLIYFGYRFYEPSLQRWMNRDPIGVRGGVNVFGFASNDPLDGLDPWGLYVFKVDRYFVPVLPKTSVSDRDDEFGVAVFDYPVLREEVAFKNLFAVEPDGTRRVQRVAFMKTRYEVNVRVYVYTTGWHRDQHGNRFYFDEKAKTLILGHELRHVQIARKYYSFWAQVEARRESIHLPVGPDLDDGSAEAKLHELLTAFDAQQASKWEAWRKLMVYDQDVLDWNESPLKKWRYPSATGTAGGYYTIGGLYYNSINARYGPPKTYLPLAVTFAQPPDPDSYTEAHFKEWQRRGR